MQHALPPATFRVAITGARLIDPEAIPRIEAQLGEVLRHAADSLPRPDAWLRLLSPLGEGADRLFAQQGLELTTSRVTLEVALPFDATDYERTFEAGSASVAEFRALLAEAGDAVFTLDGAAEPAHVRQRSYEALGQYLVRQCDLLVAVWDDARTPNGRGGTADAVRFALRSGVPVWWIHAGQDVPPRWLVTPADLEEGPGMASAAECLAMHVGHLVTPPLVQHDHEHGPVVGLLKRAAGVSDDPLFTYLAETRRSDPPIARVHAALIGALRRAGRRRLEKRHRPAPQHPLVVAAPSGIAPLPLLAPAAELSRKYQNRYRSSYLAILLLGAIALIAAVLSLVNKAAATPLLLLEIAALLAIALLWLCNEVFGWHRRYLAYRTLAELGRCYRFLAPLGRGSPLAIAGSAQRRRAEDWHIWLFAAGVRAAPAPAGALNRSRIVELKDWIGLDLIERQLRFHRQRWAECRGAEQLLGAIGVALFVGTLVVVGAKGALKGFGLMPGIQGALGTLAAFLPGLSAATFGIRSYEELSTLADQSEQMIEVLEEHAARLAALSPEAALAAQQIGAEAAGVATAMLTENAGWSELFRSKTIEA